MEHVRKPTHYCKLCGAQWIFNDDTCEVAPNTWSLCSSECGKCCDNVAMGDQIAEIVE